MIKTLKEFRVFWCEGTPIVKPVSSRDKDRGLPLSSVFSFTPDNCLTPERVAGYELIHKVYKSIRRKQFLLECLAMVALFSPHFCGYPVSREMPVAFLIASVAGALVILQRLINLPRYQLSDRLGNIADLELCTLRLLNGGVVSLEGREDKHGE